MPIFALGQAIAQAVIGIAQNAGGQVIGHAVTRYLDQKHLKDEIQEAIGDAWQAFTHDSSLADPELLRILTQHRDFGQNPRLAQILARAVTEPLAQQECMAQLEEMMRAAAPHIGANRCHAAAEALLRHVTIATSAIGGLQVGLGLLPKAWQTPATPTFASEQAIITAARAIEQELGHGYITQSHLLHALAATDDVVQTVLNRQGVSTATIAAGLAKVIKPYHGLLKDPVSENAAEALEQAKSVAARLRARETAGYHLLAVLCVMDIADLHDQTTLGKLFLTVGVNSRRALEDVLRGTQVMTNRSDWASLS
jgi:hypothetical protein